MKYSYGAVDISGDQELGTEQAQLDAFDGDNGKKKIVWLVSAFVIVSTVLSISDLQPASLPRFSTFQFKGPQPRPENMNSVLSPTNQPASTAPSLIPTFAPTVSGAWGMKFTTFREGYSILEQFAADKDSIFKYRILDGFSGVIEPYARMRVYVFADSNTNMQLSSDVYYYSVCHNDGNECIEYSGGDSFQLPCTVRDVFSLKLFDAASGETIAGGFLRCMYVRRELRSLSDRDLDATILAMWKMWEIEANAGQTLYGSNFRNYAQLSNLHYFNAAWQDADHMHEGNGFLPQHLKMDLLFSKSLSQIDPSITLFYWDFTIETATAIDVWDSPMFSNRTFGSLRLPADRSNGWMYKFDSVDSGAIPDGRWANFKVEVNSKYDSLRFGYGLMRAPWNMNPSTFLTRFTSVDKLLPTCESHLKLISYTSFSSFLHQVPYAAHASAHGVIGGVFGCDLFDPLLAAGYIIDEKAKSNLCKNWIFYMKELYRAAVLVPRKDCTSTDEFGSYSTLLSHQDCGYQCAPEMISILYLQLKSGILNSDYTVINIEQMPESGWEAWKEFICDGDGSKVFGGDHLESASPSDPSFWPIHPTLERLLHAKYMVAGFDTTDFPSDPIKEYVCNKNICCDARYSSTKDVHSGFGAWPTCCYGHFANDQMMDADEGNRDQSIGLTNAEIMQLTNPTLDSYSMDYIYDSFEWNHCSDIGFDIRSELVNQSIGRAAGVVEEFSSEKGWR